MVYLGIDIGKRTHVASLIDNDAKVVWKGFSFPSTTEGAESLLARIEKYGNAIEIGMEATGHYGLTLYSYLVKRGYVVFFLNALQVDGWRKGTELRRRKTDSIDSVLIAELIHYGDYLEGTLVHEDTLAIRNLTRFRRFQVATVSDLKRKTLAVLDQVFPEYDQHFSDVFGKTSTELLLAFQTPEDFMSITGEQLETVLEKITHKRLAKHKLLSISQAAATSFGLTFAQDTFALQLKMLLGQIKFIEAQIYDLEREIEILLEKLQSPITTIPGMGPITAATVLGEIGDINRFSTPSKLVAYAGIDATVHQSGNYKSPHSKISKRGSPHLRTALYQAAFIAARHDPTFKAFYEKKRAEGKHHSVALIACSRNYVMWFMQF